MTCNKNITLRWLNQLGGWEYFTFTARSTDGYDISNVRTFKKDIFADWPNNYQKIETETLSLEAAPSVVLRTGLLDQQQAAGVATIKLAIAIEDASTGESVTIDRSSFPYRTEREKLIQLEFRINRVSEQIQSA